MIDSIIKPLIAVALLAAIVSPSLMAQTSTPPEKAEAVMEMLAARGLEVVKKVEYVPNFTTKGWQYVEPRFMTVQGGESQTYLVSLQKCYGLGSPRAFLIPKTTDSDRLQRHDTFLVKNQGMTVAHCDVKEVFELKPTN